MILTPSAHKQTLPSNTDFGVAFSAGSMLGACQHVSSAKRIVNTFVCTNLWRALKVKQYSVTTSVLQVKVQPNSPAATPGSASSLKPLFSWYIINVNKTKENIWNHNNPTLLNTPSICCSCIPVAGTCLGSLGKQIDGNVSSKVYIFSPWWKGSLQGWLRHRLQEMRNVLANAQGSVHISACSSVQLPRGSLISQQVLLSVQASLNARWPRTNKT